MRAKKEKNPPVCFRSNYVTPNLGPYSICLSCSFREKCVAPEDKPDESDYKTRERNLQSREKKVRKVLINTLDQLERYRCMFEENIRLTRIYGEEERNCYKKQLELCEEMMVFIKTRVGDGE